MSTNRNYDADRSATLAVMAGRRPIAEGRTNWLGHQLGSGAAQIDKLLLTGATMADMSRARGAAENHLRHLRESHGLEVVELNGVFRFAHMASDPNPILASSTQPASTTASAPSRTQSVPKTDSMPAPPQVEVTGTLVTQAGDPAGRMQRIKLMLEIVVVAITVVTGLVTLVLRLRS